MRLVRDLPEVAEQIESGELTLTTAAAVQSFFQAEAKEKTAYSKSEKKELIESCLGKSTREVERELARRNPERDLRENLRYLTDERLRLSLTISEELHQKLEKLKALISHAEPDLRTEDLLMRLADLALEKLDRSRKKMRESKSTPTNISLPAPEANDQPKTRYIPQHIQRQVWQKNNNTGCEYIDQQTQKRCSSQHFLQIDHIQPFSYGGENKLENLRVLCGAHNRLMWRKFAPQR